MPPVVRTAKGSTGNPDLIPIAYARREIRAASPMTTSSIRSMDRIVSENGCAGLVREHDSGALNLKVPILSAGRAKS